MVNSKIALDPQNQAVPGRCSHRGTPTDNATVESFNGKFRGEWLNAHRFGSLQDAKEKIYALEMGLR